MAASIHLAKFRPARASTGAREPFKILTTAEMRRLCRELTPAALKVWLYHYARSGEDDTSFPRLDTIASETNQNVKTVKHARKFLRKEGWLDTMGWRRVHSGRGVPIERAIFPAQASLKAENPASNTRKLKVQIAPVSTDLKGHFVPGTKCPRRSRFKNLKYEEAGHIGVEGVGGTGEEESSSEVEKPRPHKARPAPPTCGNLPEQQTDFRAGEPTPQTAQPAPEPPLSPDEQKQALREMVKPLAASTAL
jgi:hypothetical protein